MNPLNNPELTSKKGTKMHEASFCIVFRDVKDNNKDTCEDDLGGPFINACEEVKSRQSRSKSHQDLIDYCCQDGLHDVVNGSKADLNSWNGFLE